MTRTIRLILLPASAITLGLLLVVAGLLLGQEKESDIDIFVSEAASETMEAEPAAVEAAAVPLSPMAIQSLRDGSYPGGEFIVEQELPDGTNYSQSVVSYLSEGLKIRGLLTIPLGPAPENGFSGIVFIHGYIPPSQYSTTGNYAGYQARLARSGFVTFKPDLRGHGESEGTPVSAHYSEKYVIDTLFAISYLKDHEDVDPDRIGYWGHSNGGEIGLRILVVSPDIRAASLWAGVVGSYEDMFETYNAQIRFLRNAKNSTLVRTNGLPSTNPEFWSTVDPYFFLDDIRAPVQILHGTADSSVPVVLSRRLREEMVKAGQNPDYYEYVGDDHNISGNVGAAFERSIGFFREHLQGL